MSSQFFILRTPSIIESEIKKSRFIGVAMHCDSEQSALKQLRQLAAQHSSANHLAFAWRIRAAEGFITERFFDAGEPSGTAGRPILSPLQGEDLINTVVAVIRYFGGVKLGTGGLTRAYGNAAKQAIEAAGKLPWVEMAQLSLKIDYSQLQMLEYQLKQIKGRIVDQQFTDRVSVVIELPAEHLVAIREQFSS
ncbi:YigZ family protein [Methylophaga nitratireducenticrescens]|uniref:YigZ family protein n=1 Tax=Methylophaga nitratireducenticrescens TaxID=754476 RepID=UPI000CDBECC2|nr:YigZ family protein [Methylophaga nitratireducenticrescens]AUZ84795.1 YigZ family protein [Methylophaga nitratireducenticrescens]